MKAAIYRTLGSLVLAAVAMVGAAAQQPLTNEGIIKMVKSGLGDDIIVTVVEGQPATFSITADDLIRLKQAGATDKVLAAMLRKAGAAAPAASAATTTAAPPATAPDAPASKHTGIRDLNNGYGAGSGRPQE